MTATHKHTVPADAFKARGNERVACSECGDRLFPARYNGKTVVDAFRRYVSSGDPAKITAALYDYLMMGESFIAHFDLDNFRRVYADPVDLLREFFTHQGARSMRSEGDTASRARVYKDGMDGAEVRAEIFALATEWLPEATRRSTARRRLEDLATARSLAEQHGFKIVPSARLQA